MMGESMSMRGRQILYDIVSRRIAIDTRCGDPEAWQGRFRVAGDEFRDLDGYLPPHLL